MESTYKSLKEILPDFISKLEKTSKNKKPIIGIPTGFKKLDEITLGFQGAELIVIGSRPGVGKTAFAMSIAAHTGIRCKIPTAYFSQEISNIAFTERLIAGVTRPKFWQKLSFSLAKYLVFPCF